MLLLILKWTEFDFGKGDEKLSTRAGHRAVRILQVLVGLIASGFSTKDMLNDDDSFVDCSTHCQATGLVKIHS
jgi:hypothetical protein